jgi:site-specific DNA recombinase
MDPSHDSRYAAIYARVSTEDQGKGFSIPTQIDACQQLATGEGYTVPESHVLVDEGISGTTMDRAELRKLRDLVNTKAIGAVIVYDPDRLSGNLGHQLLMAEEFERAGVKLLIVSHPLEQGPEGWLFFQMRGALAEYERAKIQERTHRGRIGRAKAGQVWGGEASSGIAPFVNRIRRPGISMRRRPLWCGGFSRWRWRGCRSGP